MVCWMRRSPKSEQGQNSGRRGRRQHGVRQMYWGEKCGASQRTVAMNTISYGVDGDVRGP